MLATQDPTRASDDLPAGVSLRRLDPHPDARGVFTEVHRDNWAAAIRPVQWNVVTSVANVLRGVHVHLKHDDYLMLLSGRATIGLRDLRSGSATFGFSCRVELQGNAREGLSIPRGVAHGFYFHEPSTHLYAVSRYFDRSDELHCHWADPGLEIRWPSTNPELSDADAGAQSLSALLAEIEQRQAGP